MKVNKYLSFIDKYLLTFNKCNLPGLICDNKPEETPYTSFFRLPTARIFLAKLCFV